MLTTCTACGTQFRVGTAQLRAVHGLVRCSRCHSVFDAFEMLQEEFEAAPPAPGIPATDELAALAREISFRESPKAQGIPARVAANPTEETAGLSIGPAREKTAPVSDDLFSAVWGESSAAPPAEQVPEGATADPPMLIEDHIPKPPDLARDQALFKHVELPPRERHITKTPRPGSGFNRWGIGAVVFALLLAAQAVNAYRNNLAHTPFVGAPVTAFYSALGHPLKIIPTSNTWLVSGINVTSDPDTPGALSIAGALQNTASFAQAWPLLRVELTDRYGDPLRARDFTANEYLPSNQTTAWLGPGMATRFRIDVVDPGPEAVGFQVQACLDTAGGRQCSNNSAASD